MAAVAGVSHQAVQRIVTFMLIAGHLRNFLFSKSYYLA